MLHELKEVREILDSGEAYRPGRGIPEPPNENELIRCVQVMMARQCIYRKQTRLSRVFSIMASPAYQGFFKKYFSVMGYEFHHDQRAQMLALKVPADARRFDWQASKLKKDETLVLLTLRLAYEEGFKENTMSEFGEVDLTTDDFVEKYEVVSGMQIEENRLNEILVMLRKRGVVELGDRDAVERVRPLTILPGVEIVVPETYAEQVRQWAEVMGDAVEVEAAAAARAAEVVDDSANADNEAEAARDADEAPDRDHVLDRGTTAAADSRLGGAGEGADVADAAGEEDV